jgi:hypothetical protein
MNVGMSIVNNTPANFYNGSSTNENKIDLIFGNYYYRQEIERNLQNYLIDTVHPYVLPTKMKYTPAYCIGFYMRYDIDKSLGFFAQFNFTKLTAKDVFLVNLQLPQHWSLDPTYREYPIWGTENRVDIDLGLSKLVPLGTKTYFVLESGFNINSTRVVENKIEIEGTTYSIVNPYGNNQYVPGAQLQTNQVIQGGIGFGVFTTTGIKLVFNNKLSMDPGMTFYWKSINLGQYNDFNPALNIFVPFVFKDLI